METEKVNLKTLISTSLVVVCLDVALMKLFGLFQIPSYSKVALARVIETGIVLLVVIKLNNGLSAIGLSKKNAFHGIKKGLIWSFGFGCLVGILFIGLAIFGINPFQLFKTRLPSSTIDLFFYFIAGGLIAPVAEEIFFRGILYGFFRKNGAVFAAIVCTLIFVSLHSIGGTVPVVQTIGGLLFVFSYEIEKSLFTPIIIHTMGNVAIFTLSLI